MFIFHSDEKFAMFTPSWQGRTVASATDFMYFGQSYHVARDNKFSFSSRNCVLKYNAYRNNIGSTCNRSSILFPSLHICASKYQVKSERAVLSWHLYLKPWSQQYRQLSGDMSLQEYRPDFPSSLPVCSPGGIWGQLWLTKELGRRRKSERD